MYLFPDFAYPMNGIDTRELENKLYNKIKVNSKSVRQ